MNGKEVIVLALVGTTHNTGIRYKYKFSNEQHIRCSERVNPFVTADAYMCYQ